MPTILHFNMDIIALPVSSLYMAARYVIQVLIVKPVRPDRYRSASIADVTFIDVFNREHNLLFFVYANIILLFHIPK